MKSGIMGENSYPAVMVTAYARTGVFGSFIDRKWRKYSAQRFRRFS